MSEREREAIASLSYGGPIILLSYRRRCGRARVRACVLENALASVKRVYRP